MILISYFLQKNPTSKSEIKVLLSILIDIVLSVESKTKFGVDFNPLELIAKIIKFISFHYLLLPLGLIIDLFEKRL